MNQVSYVVVQFGQDAPVRAGFDRLRSLADAGTVRVLDAEFIRSIHGVASTVPADRVDPGLEAFDGLDARLLGQADLDIVVDAITGHNLAAVLVHTGPIGDVIADWSAAGATVVRQGTVDPDELAAAAAGQREVSLLSD